MPLGRPVVLLLLAIQHLGISSGINSCVDPENINYRCGSTSMFLTHCGLTDNDFPDVAKCLDATAGGRSAVSQVFFAGNDVTSFPGDVFKGCEALEVLAIHDNKHLATLPKETFRGLALRMMSIARNGLTELHPELFSEHQGSLQALWITDNRQLRPLPETIFEGLGNLVQLVVSFNGQDAPTEAIFSGLGRLMLLTIVKDQLTSLPYSPLMERVSWKVALPGGDRDAMHCVPSTVPAKARKFLPDASAEVDSWTTAKCDNWDAFGRGINLRVSGEPKSGTTVLAQAVASLAVRLCGNSSNKWCRLTSVTQGFTFNFDMVHAGTGTPFLSKKDARWSPDKHTIPGIDTVPQVCGRGGRGHTNHFDTNSPCDVEGPLTRERLLACLPDTTKEVCQDHYSGSLGPAVERTVVAVRDPRNVVISEHRMRRDVYRESPGELDAFIRARFETILAWMHQRWMWHTTALQASSHVIFFEDFEENHLVLVDLAAFIGLKCSPEEAFKHWQHLRNPSPHGNFTTYGLPAATLTWMDEAMSRILPEPMLYRWGLTGDVSSRETVATVAE